MRRRDVTFGIAVAASMIHDTSFAIDLPIKPNKTLFRVGFMSASTVRSGEAFIAFANTLRENGFIEGRNIEILDLLTSGVPDRVPTIAREIVRQSPDVIVASTTPHVKALKDLTGTIPIVFFEVSDPIGSGFVENISRPEGNITGVANNQRDASLKRAELLLELVPKARRVAYVFTKNNTAAAAIAKDIDDFFSSKKVASIPLEVSTPNEFDGVFLRPGTRNVADAAIVFADPMALTYRANLAGAAIGSRIPLMSTYREEAVDGALVAYGTVISESTRLVATYVAQILKGSSVKDLPVEYPNQYRLSINLKTLAALGMEIPPAVLARADDLID